jgi:cytochrome c
MNFKSILTKLFLCGVVAFGLFACSKSSSRPDTKILVFTKTAGFRHESIPDAIRAVQKLGAENGFTVDTTENAAVFTEDSLRQYSAVVFLSTTGDILNHRQQTEFERYIQAGGGFVGIHAAADTEYDWPWYNKLVGGYFESHPEQQEAVVRVINKDHISTQHLPDEWKRFDEWYNYKSLNPDVTVLAKLDETTYKGGKNGENHPTSWYHEFDGGRAFYAGGGHTSESYREPEFLQHILGGIKYAIGENQELDYVHATTSRIPDDSRFVKVVLVEEGLHEPTELAVANSGNVYFVERIGNLKMYDPKTKSVRVLGKLNVHTQKEDGLMGLALDPNFDRNGYLYMYYSPAGGDPKNVLSRFRLAGGDSLLMGSEKVILEVPVQREECCHTGGSIAFGPDGNLFLSTGDNTNPFASEGYAPIDERPGREPWDGQRAPGNTNDLRGKILRIRVNRDGSYSIPAGNLFSQASQGRPEIYVMGNRNPYRISVDQKTGFLYWGEVGPDAGRDSTLGPRGHDEFNQARRAGNFGWPYFVGNNKPYNHYNFATKTLGSQFDPRRPVNESPNNTGSRVLPSAQSAFIWYPYAESPEFPIVGKGGRTAMGGPVYHADNYRNSQVKFPDYYDGKWFIYEWMRGWIMAVTMDKNGDLVKIEPFLPDMKLVRPMDMEFGPDGAMYLLEYGTDWFAKNADARLVRIEYAEGNRAPNAEVIAQQTVGAAPFKVKFSGLKSFDYDQSDELTYEWFFTSTDKVQSTDPEPTFTFEKPGTYKTQLRVTDSQGESGTAEVEIRVGNEPPNVQLAMNGNRSFFWDNRVINYEVKVRDKEDGNLTGGGGINSGNVAFSINYLPQGKDITEAAQGHQIAGPSFEVGRALIEGSDCKACHAIDRVVLGPAYRDVAKRYKDDPKAVEKLATKVIVGGSGNWGEREMSAHPQLTAQQAQDMVRYVLSLAQEKKGPPASQPMQGTYVANKHAPAKGQEGSYIFTVSYTDKGGTGVGPLTTKEVVILRSPQVEAESFDAKATGVGTQSPDNSGGLSFINNLKHGTWVSFKNIDLTDVERITYRVAAKEHGGAIEVRVGSPTGKVVSTATVSPTGDNRNFVTVSAPVSGAPNGVNDLYFVFTSGGAQVVPERNLFNLDWIRFDLQQGGSAPATASR